MAVNSMPPATETGLTLLVVEPLPSCPELLSPQHDADPVLESRQVCAPPVAIAGWTAGRGLVESPQPVAALIRIRKEAAVP